MRLTGQSRIVLRPVEHAVITGGFWGERRRINREVSVPSARWQLQEAGNFRNLELAAGLAEGEYASNLWFLDSDIYKWLEAIGWRLADPDLTPSAAAQLGDFLERAEELLSTAQAEDGYLDSYYQVRFPGCGSSSCSGDTSSTAPVT